MTADKQPGRALSRKGLLLATGGGLVVAALIVFGAILPAEFDKDPLGLGKLTGISRLWAPDVKTVDGKTADGPIAQFYPAAARSDVIEIPLGYVAGGVGRYSLEYKVRMKKGAVLLYDWEAVGLSDPNQLAYDFHGHTLTKSGETMTVATHRQGKGASGHGSLVAPFDGIQGWFFDNSAPNPVVIRVRLHGFYALVPPGQEGNEEGILANLPADQVKARMKPPGG